MIVVVVVVVVRRYVNNLPESVFPILYALKAAVTYDPALLLYGNNAADCTVQHLLSRRN